MKNVPKLLIVAVVLIAALYLCGVGGSLANFDADPDSLLQTFEDLFGSVNSVDLADISGGGADCILDRANSRFVIDEGEVCTFTVAGSESSTRGLKLRVDSGDRIGLFQEVDRDNRPSVDIDAFPKQPDSRETTLNFYEEGGYFEIACNQGSDDGTCIIALNP
jgi:hypothetical protein